MATRYTKLVNTSGAPKATIDPNLQGMLADGSSRHVETALLLSNPYYQDVLATDVAAGDMVVELAGVTLTAGQVADLAATVAYLSSPPTAIALDRLDVAGGAPVAAAGGDIKLVGRNLLQGQTFDHLQVLEALGGTLDIYALKPGLSGITVELIQGVGAASETYNPLTKKLVLDIGVAGSSDDVLATLINADLSSCNGILRAVSGTTGNFTAVQAEAPLTGGVGTWSLNRVLVSGLEALPANEPGINAVVKWTNTDIACTTQAVGAATDIVSVKVKSNGAWTEAISAVLV